MCKKALGLDIASTATKKRQIKELQDITSNGEESSVFGVDIL